MPEGRKVVCIIQARTGSTRLPAKVLKRIEGKEILLHVVDRVLNARTVDFVVVATTVAEGDRRIVDLMAGYNPRVSTFRGSEEDVLDRYYQAAKGVGADIVIRVTSDCPLIDSDILDMIVTEFMKSDLDYMSNSIGRRTYPRGLDAEVFTFRALERVWNITSAPEDREHVTWYIKQHPDEFKARGFENDVDLSHLRWTVDEDADFELVKEIYSRLYSKDHNFRTPAILEVLRKEPELSEINAHVEQKLVAGKQQ